MDETAEKKKTSGWKILAAIIIVAVIGAAISILVENHLEQQDRQNKSLEVFLHAMEWESQATVTAYTVHDNYTNNIVATYLFRNITSTYSFLVPQSKILFTDINILTNNVTIQNYYTAFKQYLLCDLINKAYVHNSTKYFSFMEGKFIGMSYIEFSDVAYQDDEPPQSTSMWGDDGYHVRNYTPTLEDVHAKLTFIAGILEIVMDGN